MYSKKLKIEIGSYFFLGIFSFYFNYLIGSRGVFPIDTFVHFDSSSRILKNEIPIRDFWIVHGLVVDYLQSIFFKFLGINWNAYLIHASIFNAVVGIMSLKIFNHLNLEKIHSILLALCVSVLAYPVSGTPFLDLHSAYFSLIAIYLILLGVSRGNNLYIFYAILLLGLAFFSKQVPAGYIILSTATFILFYCYQIKSFKPLIFSIYALILFLSFMLIYLISTKTPFSEFILQLFIFPLEIGTERYSNYNLTLKNIFLDFKFIYLFLIPIVIIVLKKLFEGNYIKKKEFSYFLIIFYFTISLIYHQIYTLNQIFIFFLIPILSAFLIYFLKEVKIFKKKLIINLILIASILITFKYHVRFNEQRKFHELSNQDIKNAVTINFEKNFFGNLKWISPGFKNPQEELEIVEAFYEIIKKDKSAIILITNYNFFSGLLNVKLHSPSRTYDKISYPTPKNKFFEKYKIFFKNNLIKNKIQKIYIFNTQDKLDNQYLSHVAFNYLPNKCYNLEDISKYVKKINLKKCKYLQDEYGKN